MNCMKIIYRIGILYFLCLSAGCSNSKKEIEPDNLFVTFDVVHPSLARATATDGGVLDGERCSFGSFRELCE